jgi:hypothetical protein
VEQPKRQKLLSILWDEERVKILLLACCTQEGSGGASARSNEGTGAGQPPNQTGGMNLRTMTSDTALWQTPVEPYCRPSPAGGAAANGIHEVPVRRPRLALAVR